MKWDRSVIAAVLLMPGFGAGPATNSVSLVGQSHQIASVKDENLLVRPRDASSKEGTPIVMYPREDWKCMTWKFEAAGDGVKLLNYFTHKTFYPDGDDSVKQHAVAKEDLAAEQWRFVELGNGQYRIEHIASGKVLTASPEGNVTAEKWNDGDGQKWKLLDKPAKFTG